jgi:hypothetical protein
LLGGAVMPSSWKRAARLIPITLIVGCSVTPKGSGPAEGALRQAFEASHWCLVDSGAGSGGPLGALFVLLCLPVAATGGAVAGMIAHTSAPSDPRPSATKLNIRSSYPARDQLRSAGRFDAAQTSAVSIPPGELLVPLGHGRLIYDEVRAATLVINLDTPDKDPAQSYVLQTTVDCASGALSIYAATAYESKGDEPKVIHGRSFSPPLVIDKGTMVLASLAHAICPSPSSVLRGNRLS